LNSGEASAAGQKGGLAVQAKGTGRQFKPVEARKGRRRGGLPRPRREKPAGKGRMDCTASLLRVGVPGHRTGRRRRAISAGSRGDLRIGGTGNGTRPEVWQSRRKVGLRAGELIFFDKLLTLERSHVHFLS
jgi:hypothetical protein